MANASSSTGYSTTFRNSNDETKKLIESMEEKQEQNIDEIKIVIKSVEEKLKGVSSSRSCYDIYRVPRQLYKQKPNAYTPQSVSIGPLHHNDQHLQLMETHKLHYLYRLLNRYGQTLEFCVKIVSGLEEEARKYYSDTMSLGKDKFVEMMVIDSCFILEFFAVQTSKKKDHFKSNSSWFVEISSDLIKLENQLPLFVLKHLDARLRGSRQNFSFSCYENIIEWHAGLLNGPTISNIQEFERLVPAAGGAKHFLDLLRCILIPSSPKETASNKYHLQLTAKGGAKHFLDLLRCILMPSSSKETASDKDHLQLTAKGGAKHFLSRLRCILIPSSSKETVSNKGYLQLTHNASELRSAGVKFQKKLEDASLFEIDFEKKKGILAIPTIKIFDETEFILRNLIAFEQDKPPDSRYFTAYADFMDRLVDTTEDVTLLTRKGIIENNLGSREDVVALFNNITKNVCNGNPYFSGVTKDLDEYYTKSRHKWMANLKQNYFHTPWSVISVVAAAFLIFLTVIQTVCSLMQLK